MFAGSSYTLNCTVMSDFHSVVKWTGMDGNSVYNTSSITVDAPVYNGNKTYLLLRFPALRTSQAGRYTCQSIVSSPLSVRTATKNIVVTGKRQWRYIHVIYSGLFEWQCFSTPFLSSYSEGAHHTYAIHWCPHLHSPQPHLHHSDEHRGRHLNDSDPHLARTFWEHLTLQQPSHRFQCNTSWTSVLVKYLLQFWHASLWLWYLLLYIQHQLCFILHWNKWLSGSFNKHHRG